MSREAIDLPAEFTKAIEDIALKYLGEYADSIRISQKTPAKAIHDPVWGTQYLSPAEVAILDSPLLQRLRYIHQTALAYLTFPGMRHTRFEHTLGVVAVATRLVDHLNAMSRHWPLRKEVVERISPRELQEIRIAAFLHDSGHSVFSHTSEAAFEQHVWIRMAKRNPLLHDVPASEILAYLIITSQAFFHFWEKLLERFSSDEVLKECKPERIANLIIGKVAPERAFLADIINGPFDADKLDYIVRDAYFSGLPLMVDIDRLLYSLQIGNAKEETGDGGLIERTRMLVSLPGVTALEQILMSKLHLYANVYRHHKVRAADSLVSTALYREMTDGNKFFANPASFLMHTDIDLLASTKRMTCPHLTKAMELVRSRELPMRALVLSRDVVPEGEERDRFNDLLTSFGGPTWPGIKEKIERAIMEELPYQAPKVPLDDFCLIVDFPGLPSLHEPNQTWCLIRGMKEPVLMSKRFKTMEWLQTFIVNKWRGHVFCTPKYERLLCEIVMRVVRDELQIKIEHDAAVAALRSFG